MLQKFCATFWWRQPPSKPRVQVPIPQNFLKQSNFGGSGKPRRFCQQGSPCRHPKGKINLASPTPNRGDMGVKLFSSPPPPSKPLRQIPRFWRIRGRRLTPKIPENLVKFVRADFEIFRKTYWPPANRHIGVKTYNPESNRYSFTVQDGGILVSADTWISTQQGKLDQRKPSCKKTSSIHPTVLTEHWFVTDTGP